MLKQYSIYDQIRKVSSTDGKASEARELIIRLLAMKEGLNRHLKVMSKIHSQGRVAYKSMLMFLLLMVCSMSHIAYADTLVETTRIKSILIKIPTEGHSNVYEVMHKNDIVIRSCIIELISVSVSKYNINAGDFVMNVQFDLH
jgi:hypothetical protein